MILCFIEKIRCYFMTQLKEIFVLTGVCYKTTTQCDTLILNPNSCISEITADYYVTSTSLCVDAM